MTEAEWLAKKDPITLLDFLSEKASLRKLRLLTCASCRRLWPALSEEARRSVEAAERYADGLGSRRELRDASGPYYSGVRADNCANLAARPSQGFRRQARGALVQAVVAASADEDGWVRRTVPAIERAEKAVQSSLVRDVFGNPFRPVLPDPGWLTPTVVSLAHSGYDDRIMPCGELDSARLAVLADAFEEAGCTDAAILSHLRSPGPHVRGCWVFDLLLDKR
jgi:hypothetical protein